MWRNKKLILFALLGVMLLSGIVGGIAVAQSDDENSGQTEDRFGVLLDRVSEIYTENTGVALDPDSKVLPTATTGTTGNLNHRGKPVVQDGEL